MTTKQDDDELKARIAADAKRPTVTSALRDVAVIMATEGGRASAAWLELANVLGAQLGIEPLGQRPAVPVPLVELASGNSALAEPIAGIGRRASGATQIAAPVASTGGRVVQTGNVVQTGRVVQTGQTGQAAQPAPRTRR